MKRLMLCMAMGLVLTSSSSAFAQSRETNPVKEAANLRHRAQQQADAGDAAGAMSSLNACAELIQKPNFNGDKDMYSSSVCMQMGVLASDAYGKRDWAGAERVLRSKIAFIEAIKKTDNNNDYQNALRMLNICLKTQNKSTEVGTIQAKIKPIHAGVDQVFKSSGPPAAATTDENGNTAEKKK
ncbi:MAG: hypothetical protein K2W95_26035 [Candidatus Obscuribacterales bacterium]|nr:hypothetical protein [Candidatus Obscuribacterales bacterium]